MADDIKDLFNHFTQQGTIEWIGIRPAKKAEVMNVSSVSVSPGGLEGDHYQGRSGQRDVTLIQKEHLQAVGSFLGKSIDPKQTRRNIMVSGTNLLAFKDSQFQIGEEVVLMGTGICHPCSRMEENLGFGGYNAMRGHGGITAKVIHGGIIKVGDKVKAFNGSRDETAL